MIQRTGLMRRLRTMLVVTTGSAEALYSKGGLNGDLNESFTPIM